MTKPEDPSSLDVVVEVFVDGDSVEVRFDISDALALGPSSVRLEFEGVVFDISDEDGNDDAVVLLDSGPIVMLSASLAAEVAFVGAAVIGVELLLYVELAIVMFQSRHIPPDISPEHGVDIKEVAP